jgi:hypothetical protein
MSRTVGNLAGSYLIIANQTDARHLTPVVKGSIGRDSAPQVFDAIPATVIPWTGTILSKNLYQLPPHTGLLMKKTVVGGATRVIKRDLVTITGKTAVEEGAMDVNAWYIATGVWLDSLLPKGNTGNGMIVKFDIPQA